MEELNILYVNKYASVDGSYFHLISVRVLTDQVTHENMRMDSRARIRKGLFKGHPQWGAFDSAKNHKRQRHKRQSVTAKREKSQ